MRGEMRSGRRERKRNESRVNYFYIDKRIQERR